MPDPLTRQSKPSVNAPRVDIERSAILSRMADELSLASAAGRQEWSSIRQSARSIPVKPYRAIIVTGCGDSYYAALALKTEIEAAAHVPVLAIPAMEAVAYPSRLSDADALLVAVSVSGKVEQTIDAVRAHRRRGGRTVAISASADSDLAAASDAVIATGIRGTPGPVPGTANFLGSLLALVAVAAELRLRRDPTGAVEPDIPSVFDGLDHVMSQGAELAGAEAQALRPPFFALGSGPDLGIASYGVAKFTEAAATVGVAQDLEEWAHEQYFTTNPGTTLFVHASFDLVRDRAQRVAASGLKVGARIVSVAPAPLGLPNETHFSTAAAPPLLRPLVAWAPMAMTALAYAHLADRQPFGIELPSRMSTVDDDIYVVEPSRA